MSWATEVSSCVCMRTQCAVRCVAVVYFSLTSAVFLMEYYGAGAPSTACTPRMPPSPPGTHTQRVHGAPSCYFIPPDPAHGPLPLLPIPPAQVLLNGTPVQWGPVCRCNQGAFWDVQACSCGGVPTADPCAKCIRLARAATVLFSHFREYTILSQGV